MGVRNGTWSSMQDGVTPALKHAAPASLLEVLEYAKARSSIRMAPRASHGLPLLPHRCSQSRAPAPAALLALPPLLLRRGVV